MTAPLGTRAGRIAPSRSARRKGDGAPRADRTVIVSTPRQPLREPDRKGPGFLIVGVRMALPRHLDMGHPDGGSEFRQGGRHGRARREVRARRAR